MPRAQANVKQINNALQRIKTTLNSRETSNFHFRTRPENETTMIKLGYLHQHVIKEIYDLTYRDYCGGPDSNFSTSGERKGAVWKFGKLIAGLEIYIKIQIIPRGSESKCVCISFHEAERPLSYPYTS